MHEFLWIFNNFKLSCNTQDVPGGKDNIMEGHIINYFKQKKIAYTYMCPIPKGSLYSSKIVDKKEILRTVSNTGIYCSSDKVITVYLV
jgi:hypothetical protein